MLVVNKFGRKTWLVLGSLAQGIFHLMLAFGIHYGIPALSLIGLMGFIAAFAVSSGNITWLYMAEISTEKGMGVGATISWVLTLAISIYTKPILNAS